MCCDIAFDIHEFHEAGFVVEEAAALGMLTDLEPTLQLAVRQIFTGLVNGSIDKRSAGDAARHAATEGSFTDFLAWLETRTGDDQPHDRDAAGRTPTMQRVLRRHR